jgi:hypothetical protein
MNAPRFARRFAALAALAALALPARADSSGRAKAIDDAITELDVERARKLLEQSESAALPLAFERARLAVYVGDCDGASAILSAPELSSTPEGATLGDLAKTCARATAGSLVIEDPAQGVWIRLQDEADRVLVPFLVDVAVRARKQVEADLGTELPRPLRVDLVRDLFTLSAVSGLPVNAAETTGTVAVARWGRVTMVSPRATAHGYPWEDTLAHEITHLALSRATRDHAPLWLQEGIAKREETRWRAERPFDRVPSADGIARAAMLTGRSVGVDKIGPSIAMLPSPEAASTSFSEVTSFVAYWIRENGDHALRLLFADLRGSDDPNTALTSVSGYDLSGWILRWQRWLLEQSGEAEPAHSPEKVATRPGDIVRRVRLGDLLYARGHAAPAADQLELAVKGALHEAALRFRWARALAAAEKSDAARTALGTLADVRSVHGGWQALRGRQLADAGDREGAEQGFALGIAVDPLSEEVACEGWFTPRGPGKRPASLPDDARRRALCESVRMLPRD